MSENDFIDFTAAMDKKNADTKRGRSNPKLSCPTQTTDNYDLNLYVF